jgi:hypothetical protein
MTTGSGRTGLVESFAVTLYVRFAAHMDALLDRKAVTVEPPRDASHGDLATNAAMVLAKPAGTNPRALAEALVGELDARMPRCPERRNRRAGLHQPAPDRRCLAGRTARHRRAGCGLWPLGMGAGKTVNVEYVSANPTGPMHMGHCRGAVVGDALATPAGICRAQGDPRILRQRCRRAGRCARPLGAPALPRGAGRGCRRNPGRALSRRLSRAGRAGAGRRIGDRFVGARKRMAAPVPHRRLRR